MKLIIIYTLLLACLVQNISWAQTEEELKLVAANFPPMPRATADLVPFTNELPTFASGAPFNDLEFTLLDTDYMDGENSGGDVFMPVDPSREFPGSNKVKYIRCILNTDLDRVYGSAKTDRIILGIDEIPHPFFRKGADGIDNDYAVIQHLDFTRGYIQLKGAPADYDLIYCTIAEGCQTEGWYLFYTVGGEVDLIAFIFPCWDIEPSVSGNPPNNPNPICNSDSLLNLNNPDHFKYAEPINDVIAIENGIAQVGSAGKEIVSGITVDNQGYIYLYGCSDGNLDGATEADNEIFVIKLHPDGTQQWVTELAMVEGTILKDAITDNQYLYACGRTLGALPGFTNAGRWDGILLKLDLENGEIVAMDQWGNAGIDGYGNIELDNAGNLFVSAQGSPSGPATNDELYLVAKHKRADLSNVWRALNAPNVSGFKASAEAWGGLTFVPSGAAGEGRLIAGGWYFGPRGANAFVSVYENLNASSPSRPHSIIIDTPSIAAEWVLDNAVDANGNIYVAGFTTGNLGSAPLGDGDAYIIKYSPQLTNPVIRQFGTPQSDLIRKLAVDQEGIIYALGYTYGNYLGNNQDGDKLTGDIVLQKFDQNLDLLGAIQMGTPHEERGFLDFKNNTLYIGGMTEGYLTGQQKGSFDGFAFALSPETLQVVQPDTFEPVTGLKELDQNAIVTTYPNPALSHLNVNTTEKQPFSYSIYNVRGYQLKTGYSQDTSMQIEIYDLKPGLYFLQVQYIESKAMNQIKFIKN